MSRVLARTEEKEVQCYFMVNMVHYTLLLDPGDDGVCREKRTIWFLLAISKYFMRHKWERKPLGWRGGRSFLPLAAASAVCHFYVGLMHNEGGSPAGRKEGKKKDLFTRCWSSWNISPGHTQAVRCFRLSLRNELLWHTWVTPHSHQARCKVENCADCGAAAVSLKDPARALRFPLLV